MENHEKHDQKSIADEILEGLTEFADALEAGDDLGDEFTCHRVQLDLVPQPYTPERVKKARTALRASQALFAQFLGVSVKTVRSWEQGLNPPLPIACRFMDEILQDPNHYLARMSQSVTRKGRPRVSKSKAVKVP